MKENKSGLTCHNVAKNLKAELVDIKQLHKQKQTKTKTKTKQNQKQNQKQKPNPTSNIKN
jgi:hypothetical protein